MTSFAGGLPVGSALPAEAIIWAFDVGLVFIGAAATFVVGVSLRSRLGGHALLLAVGLLVVGAAHLIESISDAVEMGHATVEIAHRFLISAAFALIAGGGWATGRELIRRGRAVGAAEKALLKAEAEASARRDFLSRVSHELRTPMNAVLGFAQLLEMDDLDESQQQSVREILSAGQHLLGLIDEVLDLARIEEGGLALTVREVEMTAVLEGVLSMAMPIAASADIAIAAAAPHDPVAFLGDEQRARQILLNLVSNAIKYNRPGGRVDIRVEHDEEHVRVSVADTGPGIAPADLPRLFIPFERLGAERSRVPGTGLGLAVSRLMAQAMGGEITVESRLESGSVFSFVIPRAAGRVDVAPSRAA